MGYGGLGGDFKSSIVYNFIMDINDKLPPDEYEQKKVTTNKLLVALVLALGAFFVWYYVPLIRDLYF